ncbi:MAG: hypothetical protein AAF236_03435 [Verrucomicrobiota bacterium]
MNLSFQTVLVTFVVAMLHLIGLARLETWLETRPQTGEKSVLTVARSERIETASKPVGESSSIAEQTAGSGDPATRSIETDLRDPSSSIDKAAVTGQGSFAESPSFSALNELEIEALDPGERVTREDWRVNRIERPRSDEVFETSEEDQSLRISPQDSLRSVRPFRPTRSN